MNLIDMDKIAVLGPKGTFCDSAYMEYSKSAGMEFEPIFCSTIDDVFESVATKESEWGIAPIENTLDGYVQRTLDLLLEKDVYIVSENTVSVQFSLIGNIDKLEDVKQLYVQFKANGQCRNFIKSLTDINPELKIVTTESNMESYYKIEDIKGAAAIVPKHIALAEKSNSDRFVVENVTDAKNNHTRFVVFKYGRPSSTYTGDSGKLRIPAYIMPKVDRPGILFEILRNFYEKGVNLISIMSRPTKQELGAYNFYVEIEGTTDSISVIINIMAKVSEDNDIKILGIYLE